MSLLDSFVRIRRFYWIWPLNRLATAKTSFKWPRFKKNSFLRLVHSGRCVLTDVLGTPSGPFCCGCMVLFSFALGVVEYQCLVLILYIYWLLQIIKCMTFESKFLGMCRASLDDLNIEVNRWAWPWHRHHLWHALPLTVNSRHQPTSQRMSW